MYAIYHLLLVVKLCMMCVYVFGSFYQAVQTYTATRIILKSTTPSTLHTSLHSYSNFIGSQFLNESSAKLHALRHIRRFCPFFLNREYQRTTPSTLHTSLATSLAPSF